MDEAEKYELESLIEELEGYRGRHTELITVLVPAGATLTQTRNSLKMKKERQQILNPAEREKMLLMHWRGL